jgi:lipopolysaccharide biosynthesis glycosyltransferase
VDPIDIDKLSQSDPVVVLAADEQFAMPLAATVRSALDNLPQPRKLRIYILDGGLSGATKARLIRSWPKERYQIAWVDVDSSMLTCVPISGHASRANYYRILMPTLLPTHVERAIYLDADLIVRQDLTELWDCDQDDRLCLAVQDCAAPCLDASMALPNYMRCQSHLGAAIPIANYRELGLNPRAEYLNSGVLVVNLAAWRKIDLPRKLLSCLEDNREHVRWWDQYALNVVLSERWGKLDIRWNQGSHAYAYPTWSRSPFDRESFEQLRDDPYIIHFTTRYKPWLASCLHPRRKEFFAYVDRTDWAGWRPWQTNRMKTMFEFARAQQRRMRLKRKYWSSRAFEWLYPGREIAKS